VSEPTITNTQLTIWRNSHSLHSQVFSWIWMKQYFYESGLLTWPPLQHSQWHSPHHPWIWL